MIELITKRLLKKDKSISRGEAERRAGEIWAAYCEANKERDIREFRFTGGYK